MAIGNSTQIYEERRYLREGETEISARAFNLIIGGVLLWGFLLNYLMVAFLEPQIHSLVAGAGPIGFLIGYFALVLIGSVMISKGGAAMSFLGYNLIAAPIGIVVCLCLDGVPASTVKTAVLMTAIVTLSFMILATIFPYFFLSLGRVLAFSLGATLVISLVSGLIFHTYSMIYEWIFVGIFSLYIGYDWARANTCAYTVDNAIDLAASLYLDIINLFLRILEIVSRRRD